MKRTMAGAEPFFFPGNEIGCLLIHGFTGTPFEMRDLGRHLAGEGFSALAPRLFGHAVAQEDMQRARWRDWMASVEDGYDILSGACKKIVVLGLSMGGILTILAASELDVQGAVIMSAPFYPPDPRMKLLRPVAPLLTPFWRFVAKPPGDWHDAQAQATHLEYPDNSVRGGAELYDLILESQRRLPRVTCPALIVQSRNDRSVPAHNAQAIYDRIGSTQKEILWLEDSGHVVTRDAERARLFEAATGFVRRCTGGSA